MKRVLAFLLAASCFASAQAKSKTAPITTPRPAAAAAAKLEGERMRAHLEFLSSDLLEGRGTGAKGGDIAAAYIATQAKIAGLKPAGENGTFMQKVPMVGISTLQEGTSMQLVPEKGQPIRLTFRDDYVTNNETQTTTASIDAPIVYVGYGISAPEYGWDDYKGQDVKGKVLLMHVNEPQSDDPKLFNGKALTYYGRWTYKYEEAARRGAAGVLLIHRTDMASYGWDVVRNSWSGERSYLAADKNPKLKAASWIQLEVAQKLLQSVGMSLDSLMAQAATKNFQPVPLPAKAVINIASKVRPFESQNVIGMVEGSDPKLKSEAVVFSGHYDHLGMRPGAQGDNIYNGAVDNGTGCAMLLEMARVVADSATKPRRSMYFVWVTGEEQGLLGSAYFGQNPPVPAGKIALNLNYDAFLPTGIPEELEVTGSERTNFYPAVQSIAKEMGMTIVPDSNPGAGYYYRSDHFSLARVGVPAFSVGQGSKIRGKDKAFGEQAESQYRSRDYHQPSDEYRADFNMDGLVHLSKLGIALGWIAANQPELAGWKPGDEFEAARKSSLK